jgi:serine/threonine protein kinase
LELKGILGTGAYGVVYSAIDHLTQTWYAVKALSKTNANGEPLDRRQREFQSREIQLHYAASAHPNIVSMLKIVDDPECTYVVLEYCPEGDLFSNITERGRYVSNDALVRQAFLQILNAVEHCHRLGIYHRDLKPENILVSHSGSQVLLADFGLATTDSESEDHGCGSTFYMSPECLDQSSRSTSYRCAPNDIWSLGVILVNLTCGRNPWKQASAEDSTYKAFTRNRDFLKTILPLSNDLNEILGMIFERNPEKRITVSELKQRIIECVHFSAPPQQLPTPPASPLSSPVEYESLSNDGSIMSDEGSLTGSCSTLSDSDSESRSESGSDSGYDSREGSPELEDQDCFEACSNNINININNRDAPQHVQRPANPAPFVQQPAYVLPAQEFQGNPWGQPAKPNQWMQHWGNPYDHQFEQLQAVHVHPAPAVYPFYPALHSPHHNQYIRHGW